MLLKNESTSTERVSLSIGEKYLLSIKEAAMYFNIGEKKIRRLAEDNQCSSADRRFSVYNGNRVLIIRTKFEKFIEESSAI